MSSSDIFFQQIINGLTIGMIYALIALGYTMVYGVARLINFAHGEVFMTGAYFGLVAVLITSRMFESIPLSFFIPVIFLIAMLGTAFIGFSIERFAYRPLREAPRLAPLITAIGVSFVLQNIAMFVFGPTDKHFPPLMTVKKISFGGITVTNLQLLIAFISVALMVILQVFIKNTRTGKAMRALADDPQAARLMGINVDRLISITFVVGSTLAGAGGVMFGAYYNAVNFHDGYMVGLKAFTAAVLGGIGNIPGALLGGIFIGVLEAMGAGYLSSAWKNVFAFFVLILILLFRPSGLLGSKMVKKV